MGSGSSISRRAPTSIFEPGSFTIRRQKKQERYAANGGSSFFSRGGIPASGAGNPADCTPEPLQHGSGSTCASTGQGFQMNASVEASGSSGDAKPKFFVYKSRRYNSYHAFMAAVSSESPKAPPTARELSTITKEKLVTRVHTLFHEYVGVEAEITAHDFGGLAASVAAGMGMDPERFRNLSDAFDRFDINGDSLLDEEECVMLAQSMLRYYIDIMHPRRPGQASSLDLEKKQLGAHYTIGQKLGQGGQGAVFLSTEIATMTQRVVKIFDKSNTNAPLEEIKEEFKLLRALDHPRIQRLYDIFEDRTHVYLISEPYFGGHLGHLIESAFDAGVHVTATYIAKALHQVLQGIVYLHSKYITHCDLKEQNVMITDDDDIRNPILVVIDFGLAHCFAERGSSGGTPGYMPPEVWTRGLWTPKGDVFSFGAMMFQLYSHGEKCFPGWNEEEVRRKTMDVMPDFEGVTRTWSRCADLPPLLEVMLSKAHHGRPTARASLENDFFAKRVRPKLDDCDPDDEVVPEQVVASLRGLGQRSRLQKACQADLAGSQNLASLKQLNAAFDAMDVDHDGVLTADEVRAAMTHEGLAEEQVEQVVHNLTGADGSVAYTLFMGSLIQEKTIDEGRLLLREFEELDDDETGYLNQREAAALLKKPALAEIVGGRDAEEIMMLMDLDGDGRVSFEEFRRVLSAPETPRTP